jgi:hypothetical protein
MFTSGRLSNKLMRWKRRIWYLVNMMELRYSGLKMNAHSKMQIRTWTSILKGMMEAKLTS